MDGFGPATYGERFADVYDDWYADLGDLDACVDRLVALAGGHPVLELGVGTGRVAVPLARRGLTVVGVDTSAAMLARLSAKAADVRAVRADAAALPFGAGAGFGLVFAAYNTFWSIGGRAAQHRCLADAVGALRPGGRVALEGMAAPDDPARPSSSVEVSRLTSDAVVLLAAREDRAAQRIEGQHVHITEDGIRLRPWTVDYLRHDQLDQLAADVGLELEHRWSGWSGEPATEGDPVAVAVYRRTGAGLRT